MVGSACTTVCAEERIAKGATENFILVVVVVVVMVDVALF
jgi:hypothetical protein